MGTPTVVTKMSSLRWRNGIASRRGTKYGARKTEYGGRIYDSKLESSLAAQLDLMCRGGILTKVEPQRTFPLYGKNGGRVCSHRVDFLVTYSDGHQEIMEAKGFPTPAWDIKRKLFEDNYPDIPYVVVKK